ncbi:MAG: hypothetical protein ACYDDF_13265 [Thermoplasmatota archaeon]
MAKLDLGGRPVSILAVLALIAFLLLITYGIYTAGILGQGVQLGPLVYVIGIGVVILGFASREDAVAVGGIMGLNLLVILDIALRIGILPKW